MLHPARWGHRPNALVEYSLRDADGTLNCRYIVRSNAILTETTCRFPRVDEEGFECYRFYVERTNPALIKKERLNSCNDL